MDLSEQAASDGVEGREWHLSERQLACLRLAAEGLTSKEIARRLDVSPSTVDSHIRAAAARLGVGGRREAVRMLLRQSAGRKPDDAPHAATADRGWLSLPPIGGRPNRLTTFHRFVKIVEIALLGTMGLAAIVFTISGVVQILGR